MLWIKHYYNYFYLYFAVTYNTKAPWTKFVVKSFRVFCNLFNPVLFIWVITFYLNSWWCRKIYIKKLLFYFQLWILIKYLKALSIGLSEEWFGWIKLILIYTYRLFQGKKYKKYLKSEQLFHTAVKLNCLFIIINFSRINLK